ncbi:MAG: hypothetical protein IKC70_08275 [Bacteroidaceae bacterium]|nr:hypothetical protein [Bacteroidaceae bacterium]
MLISAEESENRAISEPETNADIINNKHASINATTAPGVGRQTVISKKEVKKAAQQQVYPFEIKNYIKK